MLLAEEWWDRRTHPWGPTASVDSVTLSWRRARLAYDVMCRWHAEAGVTALPIGPTHGDGGQEPLHLASPLCGVRAESIAELGVGDSGWQRPSEMWSGLHRRETPAGRLDGAGPWSDLRRRAFETFGLAQSGGHTGKCFHRRGKDITIVTWTVALLLRTYGGRSWNGPCTWDALLASTVNGHTLSAVHPALGISGEEASYEPDSLPLPADGRALVVYETQRWNGVILTNDGVAHTHGITVDFGEWWRSGWDVIDIARTLGEDAGLPKGPTL